MITILIILTLITIFDAFGDGMRFKGKQVLHHIAEVLIIVLWYNLLYLVNSNPVTDHEFLWLAVYFISFRILAFDIVFNLSAGLKWHYKGNSSLWDRISKKIPFIHLIGLFFCVISLIEIL